MSEYVEATEPAAAPGAAHLAGNDPFEPLSVGRMVVTIADLAIEKAQHPASYLVRALVGGAMVAFGVLLSLMVSTGIRAPGLASMLMGAAFGMSLVLILVSGMSLVTADMAAGALALLQRRLSPGGFTRMVCIGMVGNLAGAAVFTAVCAAAGGPYLGAFAERAAAVGTAKAGQSISTVVLLGVLCTWFLQTAMFLYFKARSDVARMALAFYGPFAFVLAGTQHVVANVGFLGMPLLLGVFHDGAPSAAISWGAGEHGLLANLLCTTAGNVVGGIVFVALPFHVVARLQASGR